MSFLPTIDSITSLLLFLLLVRIHLCCTPESNDDNNDMEDILKLMRCKIDEAETVWKNVRHENNVLKSTLLNAGIKSPLKDNGNVIDARPGVSDKNYTVAVIVEQEKGYSSGHTISNIKGNNRQVKREVRLSSEQLNADLIKQNEQLKKELKSHNKVLKDELKTKSEHIKKDLVFKNEQLKQEMKRENDLFKEELQKENEILIVSLKNENELLIVDLKNKSQQLKVNMRRENEELKMSLKKANEELKASLKQENDLLKSSLKNESEHLKIELKRENDLLQEQLEKENEELLIQLQKENDQLKLVLKNKTEELKENLEKEFLLINDKLVNLERRNNLHNFSLVEVKKKMSKLLTYCQMLSQDICGSCTCADDFEQENKYYCDCTNLDPKLDCVEHLQSGNRIDGVYMVNYTGTGLSTVYCDQDNGGWLVFQRRMNGKVLFFRNWASYKSGFGIIEKEYWLGNDNLNLLTSTNDINKFGTELRIDLRDWSNTHVYAVYENFKVGAETEDYKLLVSGYSGTAGDSLSYHNNMRFSSADVDNDVRKRGVCSTEHRGPWWHKDCHESNLNGEYLRSDKRYVAGPKNIIWRTFRGYKYSLKFVEMKLRRKV